MRKTVHRFNLWPLPLIGVCIATYFEPLEKILQQLPLSIAGAVTLWALRGFAVPACVDEVDEQVDDGRDEAEILRRVIGRRDGTVAEEVQAITGRSVTGHDMYRPASRQKYSDGAAIMVPPGFFSTESAVARFDDARRSAEAVFDRRVFDSAFER